MRDLLALSLAAAGLLAEASSFSRSSAPCSFAIYPNLWNASPLGKTLPSSLNSNPLLRVTRGWRKEDRVGGLYHDPLIFDVEKHYSWISNSVLIP